MAINERLIDTASGDACAGIPQEGLILHLDANDVDSYDGDGTEWVDIKDHEYTPTTNVSEHFNTVLYDGNSSDKTVTGVGFTPDLVWIKNRDGAFNHLLRDTVRGNDSVILPNETTAESTLTGKFEFLDDGFRLPIASSGANNSSYDYVAWCFNAGGVEETNTEGTIDSTVRANNDLGFSIVKWSGDGSSATVGHGLDTPPELTIKKNLDYADNWAVNTYDRGGHYMFLNNANAELSSSQSVNSTTFTAAGNTYNRSGTDLIAYCFASKRGVSKVGSYKGTGAVGNKVYTGFEPAFVMMKKSSASGGDWLIVDNKRKESDGDLSELFADTSSAESGSGYNIDFNRDGFTLNTITSNANTSGATYIYYAVAKDTNTGSLTPSTDGTEIETDLIFDPTKVNYYGNYAFEQNNTVWRGNSSKSSGQNEGEVYVNNYFESGDTGKYYFEVKCLESSGQGGVGFTDPTKYTGGDGASQTSFRNNQLWGLSAVSIQTGGYASTTTFANSTNNTNEVTAIAIDVATGKVWMGRVLSGSITWYNSGDPSGGTNPLVTLPSNYNIYQPLVYDGSWSGGSARYAFWKIHTEAEASSLPTGFSYMTGAIKNADLELHLDADSFPEKGEAGYSNTPTTWTALTGSNGTISGATFDSELGNYLDFDGSNDYIDCGNASNIIPAGSNFTIETWVNANSNTESEFWNAVSSMGSNNPFGGFAIYNHHFTDNWGIALNKSGTWASLDTGVDIEVNKWVHLVYTYDGSNMKFFVNGDEEFSSAQSGSLQYAGSPNFEIGRNVSAYAPIKVGQVRAYSSALTQVQIRQNYNFTKPSYPNGFDGALGTGTTKPTWNPAGYFDFDGSNDYVSIPDDNSLEWTTSKSLSVWVKADTSGGNRGIVAKTTNASPYGWILKQGGSNINFWFSNSSDVAQETPTTTLPLNTWTHIVVTYDGSNLILYKNKVSSGTLSTSDTPTSSSSPLTIGKYYSNISNYYFDGQISKVKMYDKALTQSEVDALHSEGE